MSPRRRTPGRRSEDSRNRSRRTLEGNDLEDYAVPADLRSSGYDVIAADKSRGPFDLVAFKPGELLVVGIRITPLASANPHFDTAERQALWDRVALSTDGMRVVALVATATHATRPGKPCRCAGLTDVDPVRYLRLTGPPVEGRGLRPAWEPWTPDWALEAVG